MAKIAIIAASPLDQTLQNATGYYSLTMGYLNNSGVEANIQSPYRTAGTASNLTIRISANTLTVTTTIRFRKNTANGNQVISVTTGTTGEVTDSSNTDSVAAGDLVCFSVTVPVGTGRISITGASMCFAATSGTAVPYACTGSDLISTASTTYYMPLAGKQESSTTTEGGLECRVRGPGTLKSGWVNATTNARTTASTFQSRKNNANGNITISVTALTTGLFEDTSNTDSIASGDKLNYSMTLGTGVGALGFSCGATFLPDNFYPFLAAVIPGAALANGASSFSPIGGYIINDATESKSQLPTNFKWSAKRLFAFVSFNDQDNPNTIRFRIGGTNQTNVISFGPGNPATGYFEDTTHTDLVVESDDVSFSIATGGAGTTGIVIQQVGIQCLPGTTITADSPTRLELLRMQKTDPSAYAEILSKQKTDPNAFLESTSAAREASPFNQLELLSLQREASPFNQMETLSAVKTDRTLPSEIISIAREDGTLLLESIGRQSSDATLPDSWNATQKNDSNIPEEIISTDRAESNTPFESVGTLRSDSVAPIDSISGQKNDSILPVEFIARAVMDGLLNGETIGISLQRNAVPLELLASLSTDRTFPQEILAKVTGTRLLPLDWNSSAIFATSDWNMPLEWITKQKIDGLANNEFVLSLKYDSKLQNEFLSSARADKTLPFELMGTTSVVTADSLLPLDWVAGIAVDAHMPIEKVVETISNSFLCFEISRNSTPTPVPIGRLLIPRPQFRNLDPDLQTIILTPRSQGRIL